MVQVSQWALTFNGLPGPVSAAVLLSQGQPMPARGARALPTGEKGTRLER
jgi:hypothetical protein